MAVNRFTDLYKAVSGAEHATGQARYAHKQYLLGLMRQHKQISENEYQEYQNELTEAYAALTALDESMGGAGNVVGNTYEDGYDTTHPSWDKETGYWRVGTRKWDEAEAAKAVTQAELDKAAAQIALEAERERIRERNKEIEAANDRVKDGSIFGEVGYPQVDPNGNVKEEPEIDVSPGFIGLGDGGLIGAELSDEEERRRLAQIKADLDDYQSEYLQAQREEQERKDAERKERIDNGTLTIEPVVFDPPVWDPVTWSPPKWLPVGWKLPEYDGPGISVIDFTEFSGNEDYDTINGNDWFGPAFYLAYLYQDMSGTVATDLGPWAEWLATQNLRELKRIALTAGYPTLAAALADAKNLMRQANDAGYRKWAGQAPVCYMACAGLLGQWHIKSSQLALGDILNDSREIFSTAGLSDVSISGFVLRYILRDFGLEDGDNINIVISQFGRTIFETNLSLLNAGTNFEINLRPGVASIVITAIDEGAFSPNTAEIRLEDVVEGEATQTYSLLTGETATLRINPGRVGGGINQKTTSNATLAALKAPSVKPSMVNLSRGILSRRLFGTSRVDGLGIFQTSGSTAFTAINPTLVSPSARQVMQAPARKLRAEQMRKLNKFDTLKSGEIQ